MEAVVKYHFPTSPVTQGYIFTKLVAYKGDVNFGLAEVKETFNDDPIVSCSVEFVREQHWIFSEFASKVNAYVSQDTPPIISVRPTIGYEHMWVVLAYDETHWRIYDPGASVQSMWRDVRQNNQSLDEARGERQGTDILILSALRKN